MENQYIFNSNITEIKPNDLHELFNSKSKNKNIWIAKKRSKYITKVILPDTVTRIGCFAFAGCNSLKEIIIPDNVVLIDKYAFHSCESIENINIPNSVKKIGEYAFGFCESLKSITIPYGIEKINCGVFNYCVSLEKIIIPKTVVKICKHAFRNCHKLIIFCDKESYAEQYAKRNNIPVKIIKGE